MGEKKVNNASEKEWKRKRGRRQRRAFPEGQVKTWTPAKARATPRGPQRRPARESTADLIAGDSYVIIMQISFTGCERTRPVRGEGCVLLTL